MLRLIQQLKLQQKLSPQQIQYIKLLQLPTLALEQRIKTELESNPLLEEGLDDDEEIVTGEETVQERAEATQEEAQTPEEPRNKEEEYDWAELLDNTDDLYGYKARVDRSAEEEERRELPMPARVSMAEYLREQLVFPDGAQDPTEGASGKIPSEQERQDS